MQKFDKKKKKDTQFLTWNIVWQSVKVQKCFDTCVSQISVCVSKYDILILWLCTNLCFKNKTQTHLSLLFSNVKKDLIAHTEDSNLQIPRFCLNCHSFNKISTNIPH